MSQEETSDPPPASKCQVCNCEDDPGFFVLFAPEAVVHNLLGNRGLVPVNPNYPNAPLIPPQGGTPPQSFRAICQFLDDVAVSVGMTTSNFTSDANNQRRHGLFDGIQQHIADMYEVRLQSYTWGLAPGETMGSLFRVSPSGPARTTFTEKKVALVESC